ncbi:MAG: aminotransferase class I/II-fold pyridoxal phosphate-dependent enzyme, partial [Planktomarina sp.]
VLNRVRGPFNLSAPALVAGVAAVQSPEFAEKSRTENATCLTWLAGELEQLGVASDPSHSNFILARFKDQAQAEACDDFLQTQGIIVRRVGSYGLPNCLRITIPDMDGCRRLMAAITTFMGQAT